MLVSPCGVGLFMSAVVNKIFIILLFYVGGRLVFKFFF